MLQPAVKKETKNVIVITLIGLAVMLLIFFILHLIFPGAENNSFSVPFDYTVFLGGICGSAIAILNFFLMAITVQTVASMEDREEAGKLMKKSYSRRLALQCLWIVAVVFAPCFQLFAGILPILFPGIGIKIYGIFRKDLKSPAPAPSSTETDPQVEAETDTPSEE